MKLTAVFMPVPEGFIGFVEELPGANTQGATLEETRENLQEAVQLVLEANRELAERSLQGKVFSKETLNLSHHETRRSDKASGVSGMPTSQRRWEPQPLFQPDKQSNISRSHAS